MKDLGLTLRYALNTHVHADHITGTWALKSKHFPDCKSALAEVAGAVADVKLNEGDRIRFGSRYVRVLSTPGHTDVILIYHS